MHARLVVDHQDGWGCRASGQRDGRRHTCIVREGAEERNPVDRGFLRGSAERPSPFKRVVDLTAPDALKLKATMFTAAAPGPGVLLLHQGNRQRAIWDGLGRRRAAARFHVLALDLRGFRQSGGDRHDKLPPAAHAKAQASWPGDIDVAFAYLADAYFADGQKELARASAQKAIDLLPSANDVPEAFRNAIRESAEQKLKQLGAPQR